MSSVYATEPSTSGRVIFETTHGPLDISLWCRECPATTKFFLQLCLDGYYDNMLFHRIVPSLLIQTGAKRSTALDSAQTVLSAEYRTLVQADEALERRQYELNARIRFNHRGQVAMALGVSDDNNELHPQFFITTADAPYLDGKHVLFGTLGSGSPTIFNAIRINGTAVDDGTNQPLEMEHAPRVLSTKIVENQIHTDLVPQQNIPWRTVVAGPKKKKKKKRKGKFDVNVLSFGDEMEDVQEATKSRVKQQSAEQSDDEKSREEVIKPTGIPKGSSIRDTTTLDSATTPNIRESKGEASGLPSSTKNKQIAPIPLETKQTPAPHPPAEKAESLLELRRSKYTKKKLSKREREEQTIAKLAAFQQKLGRSSAVVKTQDPSDNALAARMARREEDRKRGQSKNDTAAVSYHGQVLDSDGEDNKADWMETRFKCRKHIDHSAGADGRNADEYEVVDSKRIQSHKEEKKRKPKKHKRLKEM